MRKIIQIFVGKENLLGALCDDGSVWLREKDSGKWIWKCVDISQINSDSGDHEKLTDFKSEK